mgnify:CR=1 FL=1
MIKPHFLFMKFLKLMSCLFMVLILGCKDGAKDEQEVRDFVTQWNANHTKLRASFLGRDYMDVVTYYGKERTRLELQRHKNRLFQQFPDYTQRILNDELDIAKEGGSYLVTFTKRVNYEGIEADYITYLSLISKNHKFKILREGVAEDSENLDVPIFPNAQSASADASLNRQLFGDFNGDGLSDHAWVRSPEVKALANTEAQDPNAVTCVGECTSVIMFSHKDLKPITIEGVYRSQLENLKDLNSDGADEIGFWDLKPTTKSLYIFNATNGKLLTDPVVINTSVHKNLNLIDVFKKIGPNKINVTHSAQENGTWVLKSKVITLN